MTAPVLCCLLGGALSPLFPQPAPGPQGWTTTGGEQLEVPAAAGEPLALDDVAAGADALLAELDMDGGAGVAVCAMLGGEVLATAARGHADLERGVEVSSSTVFDMASVAKSVTAFAVLRLATEGELDLDGPVRTYLPELPEAYDPVTLRQLVHHTAGVEDVEGLLALAGWRQGDPGTFEDALRVLASVDHLRFEPGTREGYSNGGYVLLARAVERATGMDLPTWTARNVFGPLEMPTARLLDGTDEIVPDRALGYGLREGRLARQRVTSRYGAGGLACSVVDLARWGEELRAGWVFGEELAAGMRQRGTLADGRQLEYAFGISRSLEGGRERWQHAGSHPGGQSYLAFYPEHGLVVAAATNSIDGPNATRIALDVAELVLGPPDDAQGRGGNAGMAFIPSTQEAPEASRGVAVDPELLASCAGTYEMEDDSVLLFAAEGERLLIGFGHQPEIEIFPLPSGRFILPPVNYEFSFDVDAATVTLHVTEESMRRSEPHDVLGHRRVERPLTAEQADAVVGTYYSPEVQAFYRVEVEDGRLYLEHARHGRMPLSTLGEDSYGIQGRSLSRLTFRRTGSDVTGFELEAYSWSATATFTRE